MASGSLSTRSSFTEYAAHLRDRRSFTTRGALSGRPGPATAFGMLDHRWHASAGQAAYVVYSYRTPIAWLDTSEGWVQPPDRYSTTTSRHQSLIATAISTF